MHRETKNDDGKHLQQHLAVPTMYMLGEYDNFNKFNA